jgi:hypothetical protein
MGGKLTAQNSAHGGAVFELRIPVQSRALPDHPPLAAPQGPISPTDTSLGAVLKASTDRIDDTPAWPQSGTSTRPRPAQESKKAAPATPRAPHLLFIERAPGALMAMRMHLARKGYLTSTAETLPEAEAVARSHSLSLVLTDHLVATNAEGPICPSILSAIRTVDPSLPILGLVAHHPLPVASGGGLTQSTRPLNGGTNEAPVHVIRQAVGLSDLYDIVQSIQRTG